MHTVAIKHAEIKISVQKVLNHHDKQLNGIHVHRVVLLGSHLKQLVVKPYESLPSSASAF